MSTTLGEALVGIVAVATLPAGILAAVFLGVFEAFLVFVVGWLLLVPVLGILMESLGQLESGGSDASDSIEDAVEQRVAESIAGSTPRGGAADGSAGGGTDEDPLETLRERYARGEIDDVEFERKLDRLIQTEDVEVPPEVSLDRVDEETDSEDREPAFEQ